tara:strand:- start:5382 stop:5675 length:294 start_codon:yes stop_codon:yes gene_type:complete
MCFPKMPDMPSAEEQSRQQLEIQRQLQSDADSRAADQLKSERKTAAEANRRRRRGRRGRTSLITPRPIGGMFGNEDTTANASTIKPLGSSLYGISNE